MKHTRFMLVAASLMAMGTLSMAQPESPPPRHGGDEAMPSDSERPTPPRGRVGLEIKLDPAALRLRLERMIARGQDMVDRGQAALAKLDEGSSATDVLNELRMDDSPRRVKQPNDPQAQGPEGAPPQVKNDLQEIHAFLKAEFPELWSKLSPIVEQDPRSAERLLGRMAPQIREILALQKTQPVLARIKTEQMRVRLDFVEASRLYRQAISDPSATDSDRANALERIRVLAAKRFDIDLSAKQFEIDRLEARLDELRASLTTFEDRRDVEIQQMTTFEQRNAERLARQQAQRRSQPANESADD
jgi:hypothetical protein